MSLSSPTLRRFVKHALISGSDVPSPSVEQLAASFNQRCGQLRVRLQPIFGSAAIDALFARALRVAATEYPWLSKVIPEGTDGCSVDSVTRVSTEFALDAVADGLATLLAHDIGLLTTFIGADFVMPLVQAAWQTEQPHGTPATIEGDHD
jgi:hypothetical protein